MDEEFDIETFKHAISMVESIGGKLLSSTTSSATGRYHFLYELIKNDSSMRGVSQREFMNNRDLQEKIMDRALNGTLHGYGKRGYINDAIRNKSRYNSDLRIEEIAALQHFLGAGGVRTYLKDPSVYKVKGVNLTPQEYLTNYNEFSNEFTQDIPQFGPQQTTDVTSNTPSPIKLQEEGEFRQLSDQHKFKQEFRKIGDQHKKFSDGGSIHTEDNNPFVEFHNGGTHEQNPLGGIPIGNGNSVEAEETKFDFGEDGEYIFSARIGYDSL